MKGVGPEIADHVVALLGHIGPDLRCDVGVITATDLLVIENVGNLVCPANFDLGEDLKVVVLSVTEGDDKPLKYPAMFQRASVLVINKVDLVPYVDSDVSAIRRHARLANPDLQIFETSCRTGEGIAEWAGWLAVQAERRRA